MSGFLVDTNVLSEARKGVRAHPNVRAWLGAHGAALYLSVLVTGEVRRGIESVRRRDPRSATLLDRWLRGLESQFEDRILPVDARVADRWGRLTAGRSLPVVDALLAATALVHHLTLATRNARDVAGTGVAVVNPFLA